MAGALKLILSFSFCPQDGTRFAKQWVGLKSDAVMLHAYK